MKKKRLDDTDIAILHSALVFFFAYCAAPAQLSLKVRNSVEDEKAFDVGKSDDRLL